MPLYLSEEKIGKGTHDDPFRPRGSDQAQWSALYLGDTGRSLLWLSEESSDPALTLLALDKDDTVPAQTKSALYTKLQLPGSAPVKSSDVVAEIMLTGGKGWRPVRANAKGYYEVWVGGQLWHSQRAVQGGATASSTFTGSEDPLSESGLWDSGPSSWNAVKKVSGRAAIVTGNSQTAAYLATPAIGIAQYSQGKVYGLATDAFVGVICRGNGNESYILNVALNASIQIFRTDSGLSFTQLAGGGVAASASGDLLYLSIDSGDLITAKRNGVDIASTPFTDTSGPDSGQPGMYMYTAGVEVDDWEGGDLAGGAFFGSPVMAVLAGMGNL